MMPIPLVEKQQTQYGRLAMRLRVGRDWGLLVMPMVKLVSGGGGVAGAAAAVECESVVFGVCLPFDNIPVQELLAAVIFVMGQHDRAIGTGVFPYEDCEAAKICVDRLCVCIRKNRQQPEGSQRGR